MNAESRHIARRAATVAGTTLVSRVLGFVRDLITAFALGAGLFADAFFVAFRIPNLLRSLFAEGSLTMAFIPTFSRVRAEEGEARAQEMARSVLAWLVSILAVITLLAILFAPQVTALIAPGFGRDPALLSTTADLLRICFPFIVFISAVGLCMGILNAMDHFFAPAFAPCLLNIGFIASALLAVALGWNVAYALAWGVLASGLAQWLFQQPYLGRLGFSWRGPWKWRDPAVLRMGRLMLPSVLGSAVYQINLLLGTLLASFLPVGSISYLYYADRLVQFPVGVFGLAVSTAALPSLSRLAAAGQMDEFKGVIRSSMRLSLFISLPAMAGLIALAAPLIGLLFGRGAFGPEAIQATAAALVAYGVGLPAIALVRPLVGAFYALENTRLPVMVAALCVAVNIGLGFGLMQFMSHAGLALAVSVASYANVGLLSFLLRRRLGQWPMELAPTLKCAAASLVMGLGAWATAGTHLLWALLIPFWAVAYFGLARAFGLSEARQLAEALARRLKRRTA
ncbi:MAG: murein biosynthesis integral membrane protein MurJ [Desulfovibrio sp.]|jgi:putative peptidoglycan lipid II flippase|nr:murein biosynthesis integral membrane protein MurJ [Desulfovibrio sp.]